MFRFRSYSPAYCVPEHPVRAGQPFWGHLHELSVLAREEKSKVLQPSIIIINYCIVIIINTYIILYLIHSTIINVVPNVEWQSVKGN